MPLTQDTLRYPIRKTRSSSKSTPKKTIATVSPRSTKFVSRYGNRVIKSPLKTYGEETSTPSKVDEANGQCTKSADVIPELPNRSPGIRNELLKDLFIDTNSVKEITLENSANCLPSKNEATSRILSDIPRKNLNRLFENLTENTLSICESDNIENVENELPRTPLSSPSKQRKEETPKKLEGQDLPPPLSKSPKRRNPDQIRTAATSPPKRSKENCLARRCLTPIALFKQNVSSYQAAKEALMHSTPTRLVGRDRQLKDLQEFLKEHLVTDQKPGCLYISGAPGTGKTASLTQILQELQDEDHSFTSIFINCMTVGNSGAIFERIAASLGNTKTLSAKDKVNYIEKMLCKQENMVILVLDEMDQLSTKNQQVLYSVFEWPRLPKSKLLLIGIANALDMTDRILPRLHACGCQPTLLNFPPYSQSQITAILEDRLNKIGDKEVTVIKPAALQLCARKIAAQTGDVRKALDTCRRAVELVENKVKNQQVLRPTCDDGSNPGSPRRSPRKLAQVVDLSQIMGVLHEIYGSRMISCSSKQSDLQSSMPIQQKLLLCTLLLLTKHKFKGRDLTLGKFHEVYSKVCRIHKVEVVASVDFQSMCLLAESNGLVQIKSNRENRLSKILLKVDEDELQFVMKDKNLLSAVLSDQSVLK